VGLCGWRRGIRRPPSHGWWVHCARVLYTVQSSPLRDTRRGSTSYRAARAYRAYWQLQPLAEPTGSSDDELCQLDDVDAPWSTVAGKFTGMSCGFDADDELDVPLQQSACPEAGLWNEQLWIEHALEHGDGAANPAVQPKRGHSATRSSVPAKRAHRPVAAAAVAPPAVVTEPVDDGWSTLLNALRHNRERPGSGTNARLAQLANDLLKSLRSRRVSLPDMTPVNSLVLEILAKHGYIIGEFANQFEHELTAAHMEKLEIDLRFLLGRITCWDA
jgi:hypothetical protein